MNGFELVTLLGGKGSLPLRYPPLEPFWTSFACRKMCFSSSRWTRSDPLDGFWRIGGFVSGCDRMPQTSRRKSSSTKSSSWKVAVAPFQVAVIVVVAILFLTLLQLFRFKRRFCRRRFKLLSFEKYESDLNRVRSRIENSKPRDETSLWTKTSWNSPPCVASMFEFRELLVRKKELNSSTSDIFWTWEKPDSYLEFLNSIILSIFCSYRRGVRKIAGDL